MDVKVIYESDLDIALLGTGLSFGKTSGMDLSDITDNREGIRDHMLGVVRRLAPLGNGHNKAIRQVLLAIDCCAPLYWWKEASTYKVSTVAQSESTMHTITRHEFTPTMFELDQPDAPFVTDFLQTLNNLRTLYLFCEDEREKGILWRRIIQYLPCSFLQRRILTCNYETLRCIFRQRKGHKLVEWKTFIDGVYATVRHPEFLEDLL